MEDKYKILIENDFKNFKLTNDYDKVLIITDDNVKRLYLDDFLKQSNLNDVLIYSVPPGEESKSIKIYEDIFKFSLDNGLNRKSLILTLGGGVVGDLGGFIASTYMRGIDLIHLPTTLLSQVDSSIGGKNGINIENYKNVMGSFYNPKYIYMNVNTIKTLRRSEFLSGLSEVIKYGLIYDYEFLNYLLENNEDILNLNEKNLLYIIRKCSNIKLDIVKLDEKESNIRKVLNLGHSFGHGIEKLGKLSHGYAVSIGTHMAFKLSLNKKFIDKDYYDKVINLYKSFNLPTSYKNIDSREILDIMKRDKKNSYSKFNLILPIGHGKVDIIDVVKEEEILCVIEEVGNEYK